MQAYLTPEDFARAKENGIEYETVYNRFYILGWPIEKAVTKPVARRGWKWADYEEACAKAGVTKTAFVKRLREGWDLTKASTTPFVPYSERRKNVRITDEVKKTALQNGIPEGTLKLRVYHYKWSVQRAMTEPVHTKFRRNDYEATRT